MLLFNALDRFINLIGFPDENKILNFLYIQLGNESKHEKRIDFSGLKQAIDSIRNFLYFRRKFTHCKYRDVPK